LDKFDAMHPLQRRSSFILLAMLIAGICSLATPLPAEDKPALVLENGGLKSIYRVVFQEWDDKNNFARGVVEMQGYDSEEPEMRLPFAVELKPSKDKKVELLEVRSTSSLYFFPPAEKKEPYPLVTWTLTGRKSGRPVLKAKMWSYNAEKETWTLEEMEFEKPAQ
jgi:hypothetical protein